MESQLQNAGEQIVVIGRIQWETALAGKGEHRRAG